MATTDDIFSGVSRLEEQAQARFRQLASELHRGDAIAPAEVLEIIRAAGKTNRDLQNLVGALTSRDAAKIRADEYAALHVRNAELRRQIDAANEELEVHVAKHREATAPLQSELHENQFTKAMQLASADNDLVEAEERVKKAFAGGPSLDLVGTRPGVLGEGPWKRQ